jgi:predicted AAA+ superfamily ATPase
MENLLEFQNNILRTVTNDFRRYLHDRINWNQRMIGIKGPRGAGKTTLMLQHLKFDENIRKDALYVTADHPWFYTHSLLETANNWFKQGGKFLFIDEVHKYPKWSSELKNIYDGLPGMKIVFSASSALDIYRGEADLSRRVITYPLGGLSFREYIFFTTGKLFNPISPEEIKNHHSDLSYSITENFRPLPEFRKYLKFGYLPFFKEDETGYFIKLEQIVNTIVDTDLAYIAGYNSGTASKIKKLLGVIAESVPFKPNIASIARKLELSRDSVYQYITLLNDAKLVNSLVVAGKGISTLQKPEKLYLENPNLAFALTGNPEVGNLRETFVLNQLINSGAEVTYPQAGDFMVNETVIEVGGKTKSAAQVNHLEDFLIAADDIETGANHKVPIWLFGFLY